MRLASGPVIVERCVAVRGVSEAPSWYRDSCRAAAVGGDKFMTGRQMRNLVSLSRGRCGVRKRLHGGIEGVDGVQ